MKHKLILAAAVSLAMASTAMAQTSSGTSDTTSGASSGTSATTSGATTATPGMLQMSEAEKSTIANWSGAIADAFFSDSTITQLKSGTEIRSAWPKLTPEQQAQVEQDCNTMQTASAGSATMPTTDGGGTTGTSTDNTASTSGTTGTTGATTGTSSETTASTSTDSSDSAAGTGTGTTVTDPATIAQLCDFVGSM